MYIWINYKYSSTSFKQRLWQRKMVLIITNLPLQVMSVTLVQWSRSCLYMQINRVRLPATLFLVSLSYRFFFFGLCLLTLFFLPVFLYSYCWPRWSRTWINIYFKLKSGVLFWKRDFKSSWSSYWPRSLRPEKNDQLSRHALLWNSWSFFSVSWHHDTQHTVHQKLY